MRAWIQNGKTVYSWISGFEVGKRKIKQHWRERDNKALQNDYYKDLGEGRHGELFNGYRVSGLRNFWKSSGDLMYNNVNMLDTTEEYT